jgi:hypothetical protein
MRGSDNNNHLSAMASSTVLSPLWPASQARRGAAGARESGDGAGVAGQRAFSSKPCGVLPASHG